MTPCNCDGGGSISHAPGPSCTSGPGAIVPPVVQDQAALDEMIGALTARAQEWIADDAAYAQRCLAFAASFAVCDHPHRYARFGERVATCVVCGHQEDVTDDHDTRTFGDPEPAE